MVLGHTLERFACEPRLGLALWAQMGVGKYYAYAIAKSNRDKCIGKVRIADHFRCKKIQQKVRSLKSI